jgi:hypothetical protein
MIDCRHRVLDMSDYIAEVNANNASQLEELRAENTLLAHDNQRKLSELTAALQETERLRKIVDQVCLIIAVEQLRIRDAEIERLREEVHAAETLWSKDTMTLRSERDSLKDAFDIMKNVADARAVEIERLHAKIHQMMAGQT